MQFIPVCILFILSCISIEDIRSYTIPNRYLFCLLSFIPWICFRFSFLHFLFFRFLPSCIVFLLCTLLRLPGGDRKLLSVSVLLLSIGFWIDAMSITCFSLLLYLVAVHRFRPVTQYIFPLGPFINLGTVMLYVLYFV